MHIIWTNKIYIKIVELALLDLIQTIQETHHQNIQSIEIEEARKVQGRSYET